MGLDAASLPEHLRKLISPEDRAALGRAVETASDAQRRWQRTEEKRIHVAFEAWLGHHTDRLYWDHSRTDKATTNRVGHPDFVIQGAAKVLNIEFKASGGVLSEAQREVHAWIERTGGKVHVCFNEVPAIELVRRELLA